jgi:hypothetical protein
MENLYKEAIADAKALRASAMANAKAALEEAFEPKLKEMFRKTVEEAEEIEENEDLEEADEMGNAKHKVEEKKHKKDAEDLDKMDEVEEIEEAEEMEEAEEIEETMDETSLEEILGELEALAQEGENHEGEMEEEYTEDGMEETENFEAKSEEDGEEEESEEGEEEEVEMDGEEVDGEEEEKVITITLGQLKDILAPYQGEEEGAEGAEGEEATDDINLDEIFAELEEASKEKVEEKKEKMKAGKDEMEEQKQLEVPGTEKQLKEANQTISYLQTQLKEVNLLNAKYLFMNKLFKAKSLTESQKIKAINAFDRATTVKEVKNTFATLNESFSVSKKKSINEGFASQAAGNAPKQSQTIESDPFISRMQVLAGINKK